VVHDIAVDPHDPAHLYIGVGPSLQPGLPPYGILESHDSGDTWTQVLTTTSNVWTITIDPQNDGVIYASTLNTIYRSFDGGRTWMMYHQGGEGDNFQVLYIPWEAPAPVTGFVATPQGDQDIALSWTNPEDITFAGTLIRYSTITYPLYYDEGSYLADRLATPGSDDAVGHSGVTSGTTYYYAAFAHDEFGHYSQPSLVSAVAGQSRPIWIESGEQAAAATSRASTLYLGAGTGLYRRSLSVYRVHLPLALIEAP
jgi:hypothetical protein